MNPWKVLGASAAASVALTGYVRPGTLMFYAQVGAAMGVAQYVRPQYVATAGGLTAVYVMLTSNYVHPFGPGSNPLKRD